MGVIPQTYLGNRAEAATAGAKVIHTRQINLPIAEHMHAGITEYPRPTKRGCWKTYVNINILKLTFSPRETKGSGAMLWVTCVYSEPIFMSAYDRNIHFYIYYGWKEWNEGVRKKKKEQI